jgi:hypothetical protein
MRHTFAARYRDILATMPFSIHLRQSDEIPFHGEPRQRPALSATGLLTPAVSIACSAHGSTDWFNSVTLRVTAERRPDVGIRRSGRV